MRRSNSIQWAEPRQPHSDWGYEQDAVVWVSVPALDAAWMSEVAYYIEACGKGAAIDDRYSQFGEWFVESLDPVELPVVSLDDDVVGFIDGRHRFAWFRDHGVLAIPVQVPADLAHEFEQRFGIAERTSLIPGPDFQ